MGLSQFNLQAIIGQRNILRQFLFHRAMEAKLVADVGEVGFGRFDAVDHGQRFAQVEVGDVRFDLQGVQHQDFGALQAAQGFIRNNIGVGDVAEVSKTKTQHGQTQVEHGEGCYGNAVQFEGPFIDLVECYAREAGVSIFRKGIGELHFELVQNLLPAIHRHVAVLHEVVGAHVVQPGGVVAVGVGEDHRVEALHIFAEHLLAEIGAGVYDKALAGDLNANGGAEAFVPEIQRLAYFAAAADDGHSLRCTGAEERYFQAASV